MKYADFKIDKSEDKYRITASTGDIDRDGEIILPAAYKNTLPKYLKTNPVILWAHDYKEKPVGKATGGRITDKSLELDIEFAPTDAGQEVKSLYDGGFLNSFSVGFIPKNGYHDDKTEAFTFDEVELLEVSCVPVPANASANMIRAAGMKGYKTEALIENIGVVDPVEEDIVEPEVSEVILTDEVENSPLIGLADQAIRMFRR
jgi:uncharacterized protein